MTVFHKNLKKILVALFLAGAVVGANPALALKKCGFFDYRLSERCIGNLVFKGARYEGVVSYGVANGKGKYFWDDGSWHEGEFKDNKPHGWGTQHEVNTGVRYEGNGRRCR